MTDNGPVQFLQARFTGEDIIDAQNVPTEPRSRWQSRADPFNARIVLRHASGVPLGDK